jgi:hypothetical protein
LRLDSRAKAPTKAPRAKKPAKAKTTPKAKKDATRAKSGAKEGKLSLLDAAAEVLKGRKNPMRIGEVYDAVIEKGLWKPGAGKTPKATLSAAVNR